VVEQVLQQVLQDLLLQELKVDGQEIGDILHQVIQILQVLNLVVLIQEMAEEDQIQDHFLNPGGQVELVELVVLVW
jgi:hypothetical protein